VTDLLTDVASLSTATSPGAAVRLLKHVDSPADLKIIRAFATQSPSSAASLHILGSAGVTTLKTAAKSGPQATKAAESLLLQVARKGRAGANFLNSNAAKAILKPHPLLGIAKAIWKGNAQKALSLLADRTDPHGWWILPAFAAWCVFELIILAARFRTVTTSKPKLA